ncbi:protein adenylyltransferase SelO [Nocardioides nanhaiensis]|uniref:Protein nucleotidyltransferase YdiU n=1 Tax=Nocardioides nanhaiensis TaxID=1476871 RepID=A0ABP8VQS7_9ACTN
MTTTPATSTAAGLDAVRLSHRFADALPELARPWRAQEAPQPQLLVLDEQVAGELGLDAAWLRSPEGARFLAGNAVPPGAEPVAQCYAGHQFGGYSPRLGDGRALLLGEIGDRGTPGGLRDLHLKGSGRTPFARGGDGLAAVGPMLREHVMSLAMHALGVPTTRSLAVVATGAAVQREQPLPGAVLARVAASHLRVGSFQYARATDDLDLLERLVQHAIERHHPQAADAENPALALFEAVVAAQARLVARWMLVGFVHGVMNTDNMTISGETIDYGPCAFLDGFDPATVFSSIDEGGRYAYGNQPGIAAWNLARLAETLVPLVAETQEEAVELLTGRLGGFQTGFGVAWTDGVRAKLGLAPAGEGGPDDAEVQALADGLLALLREAHADWTGSWRALGAAARGDAEPLRSRVVDLAGVDAWLERWRAHHPDAARTEAANPVYIPRNHLVEEALDAATEGDLGPVERLLAVLADPFTERPGLEAYAEPAPESFGQHVTYCGT